MKNLTLLILLILLISSLSTTAQTVTSAVLETQYTSDYLKFRDESIQSFLDRSKKIDKEFKLGNYDRWDFAQESRQIIFSDKGVKKVIADVEIAGTWAANGTWMWAWTNESIDSSLKMKVQKVRELGSEKHFFELTTPQLKVPLDYAWTLIALAGGVTKAKTSYRGENGSGYVYFLITDLKWVKQAR